MFVRRRARWFCLVAGLLAWPSTSARAQVLDAPKEDNQRNIVERAQAGDFWLNMTSASVGDGNGVASFLGGYDGAKASGVFAASAEAFIFSRLAFRAGAAYLPSESRASVEPQLELRWQFLKARTTSASLGVLYRRDQFTDDGGMTQVVASASKSFERVGVVANVAYGRDQEGDDRLTEVRCGGLFRVNQALLVGATAAAASGWGSTDGR